MPFLQRGQIAGMNIHHLYYSLNDFLDAQARAGFCSIELWGGAPHFWLDDRSFGDCRAVRCKAGEHGLQIVAFTPESVIYPFQVAAQETWLFEKSAAYFANAVRAAAELGCRIMTINSGWGYRNEDRQAAWDRARSMLARLAEVGRQEGVLLAMETLRPEESQLVTTLADARRMHAEIDHPHLKLMLDTCAMGVAGETIQQWFDAFGAEIVHTHFVDGTPYGHLVWGDGDRPLAAFLATLQANGYRGFLGQEITDARYFADPAGHDRRNMQRFEAFMEL